MDTLFRRAFGDTPKIRVLEFLIEGRELDYHISDIAEGAEIGRTTLFRIWDDLIRSGIIIPTRQIGNAKLYKLNQTSPFVKKLVNLFDEVKESLKALPETNPKCKLGRKVQLPG